MFFSLCEFSISLNVEQLFFKIKGELDTDDAEDTVKCGDEWSRINGAHDCAIVWTDSF